MALAAERTPPPFCPTQPCQRAVLLEKLRTGEALSVSFRLQVFRHGETEMNAAGLVTGSRETALTPRGIDQAKTVGKALRGHYQLALCSTLQRSWDSLNVALENATGIHVEQLCADERLAERDLGVLEARPAHHVPEFAQGNLDYAPSGGESYREVAEKLLTLLYDVAVWSRSQPCRMLISTHMGPMRMLHAIAEDELDPVAALNRHYENGQLLELSMSQLRFPRLLGG